MAYNRRNYLLRVCKVQDITLEHTKRGVTQKWVFDNLIRDKFFISFSTYCSYLGINAKRELAKMDAVSTNQPSLFD